MLKLKDKAESMCTASFCGFLAGLGVIILLLGCFGYWAGGWRCAIILYHFSSSCLFWQLGWFRRFITHHQGSRWSIDDGEGVT